MANRYTNSITYIAEEDIPLAIEVVGTGANKQDVGKAIKYGTQEIAGNPGGKLAQEGDYLKFAGVVKTVSAEAKVVRDTSSTGPLGLSSGAAYYNDGGRTVLSGQAMGVERGVETFVKISGPVAFGDFITTANNGLFKTTAVQAEKVGIARQAGVDGAVIKVYIDD